MSKSYTVFLRKQVAVTVEAVSVAEAQEAAVSDDEAQPWEEAEIEVTGVEEYAEQALATDGDAMAALDLSDEEWDALSAKVQAGIKRLVG